MAVFPLLPSITSKPDCYTSQEPYQIDAPRNGYVYLPLSDRSDAMKAANEVIMTRGDYVVTLEAAIQECGQNYVDEQRKLWQLTCVEITCIPLCDRSPNLLSLYAKCKIELREATGVCFS